MTKLLWDQTGEKLFEAGLDHGVLYLPSGVGISWTGLRSIEENFGGDGSTPRYFDGVKARDEQSTGDFSAKLTAYTFPDEFLDLDGLKQLGVGLFTDGQRAKPFSLSYRTLIGNDVNSTDQGYKIHLLYNLTAAADTKSYSTLSDTTNVATFSWTLTGVPEEAPRFRPTAHVILDSRFLSAMVLEAIEDILYGQELGPGVVDVVDGEVPISAGLGLLDGGTAISAGTNTVDGSATPIVPPGTPRMPPLSELIDFVLFWDPKSIVPNSTTGLSVLVSGFGDLTQTKIPGVYSALPDTRLVKSSVDGFYLLV